MRRGGLLVAAAVIVFANGVVLMEVARNRAAGPVETIQLTERELPLDSRGKEDTGVEVHLNWRRFSLVEDDLSWLDQAKLEELGFDYTRALRDPRHPPLPRPAFVALEYDGPAWEQWLKSAQQDSVARGGTLQTGLISRLVPIDLAKTPEPLLQKYQGRGKYLIVRGVVQLSAWTFQAGGAPKPLRLQPNISELLPGSIHVPRPLSDVLGNLSIATPAAGPRYNLTLAYGRSFEPWIVAEPDGR